MVPLFCVVVLAWLGLFLLLSALFEGPLSSQPPDLLSI